MGGKVGSRLRKNDDKPKLALMSDMHRTKIANAQVFKFLVEHAIGKRDMSSTQVTAAIALLKKYMPDMAAIEIETGANGIHIHIGDGASKL